MITLQPVILSGGSGTRLWPLSRTAYPKQLLPLVGEDTMLQETVLRLEPLKNGQIVDLQAPLVVANEEHRFMVAEQLRRIDHAAQKILLEPFGRNTAPALTLAALAASENGQDPVLMVMPADHHIRDKAAFEAAAKLGAEQAEAGQMVTFGIVPTHPETGYGYIQRGQPLFGDKVYELAGFVEKPDLPTAQSYLDCGEYLWNSGIFMMKASRWLAEIAKHNAAMAEACRQAWHNGTADMDFHHIHAEDFQDCPSDSIDYAVIEKITGTGAAVIPLDAGWSDVGSWAALRDVRDTDEQGNVTSGDTLVMNGSGNLVMSEHRFVAALGLDNVVVVETADAVLVADRDRAQDVKKVAEYLKADGRDEHQHHRQVQRPWGTYESIDSGNRHQVKHICVQPGASLSLQMHHHRAEHWIVVSGTARVTKDDETFLLSENQSTYIPLGVTHRLENPGTIPLEIIEVQSGSYLGEDDIVRFEDVYNRTES